MWIVSRGLFSVQKKITITIFLRVLYAVNELMIVLPPIEFRVGNVRNLTADSIKTLFNI